MRINIKTHNGGNNIIYKQSIGDIRQATPILSELVLQAIIKSYEILEEDEGRTG